MILRYAQDDKPCVSTKIGGCGYEGVKCWGLSVRSTD
jgi:hypothetical protein